MLLQQLMGALVYITGKHLTPRNTRDLFASQVMKHAHYRPGHNNTIVMTSLVSRARSMPADATLHSNSNSSIIYNIR